MDRAPRRPVVRCGGPARRDAGLFGDRGEVEFTPVLGADDDERDVGDPGAAQRLEQVEAALDTLRDQEIAVDDLPRRVVEVVYADVDEVLWGAAELSVRAQLAYLLKR